MVEKRVDRSRRKVIRAVARGVTAGLLLRISRTDASEKMTRQQAEYQDTPNGMYSCGMCTLFEPARWSTMRSARTAGAKDFVLAD